jgi:hypothetical protein
LIVFLKEFGDQRAVMLKKSIDEMLDDKGSTSNDMMGDPVKIVAAREDADKFAGKYAESNGYQQSETA